jgi:hypothetical protein
VTLTRIVPLGVVSQGTVVSAIAFDPAGGTDSTTKAMLVGSSRGQVYEASVESSGKEKGWNLVSLLSPSPGFGNSRTTEIVHLIPCVRL